MVDGQVSMDNEAVGYVYVMTHSIFSDVVRVGCTPNDPVTYASDLSKRVPGEYFVAFAQQCKNPCSVTRQVKDFLKAKSYVNEFYQVPPDVAEALVRRETLRIPIVETS